MVQSRRHAAQVEQQVSALQDQLNTAQSSSKDESDRPPNRTTATSVAGPTTSSVWPRSRLANWSPTRRSKRSGSRSRPGAKPTACATTPLARATRSSPAGRPRSMNCGPGCSPIWRPRSPVEGRGRDPAGRRPAPGGLAGPRGRAPGARHPSAGRPGQRESAAHRRARSRRAAAEDRRRAGEGARRAPTVHEDAQRRTAALLAEATQHHTESAARLEADIAEAARIRTEALAEAEQDQAGRRRGSRSPDHHGQEAGAGDQRAHPAGVRLAQAAAQAGDRSAAPAQAGRAQPAGQPVGAGRADGQRVPRSRRPAARSNPTVATRRCSARRLCRRPAGRGRRERPGRERCGRRRGRGRRRRHGAGGAGARPRPAPNIWPARTEPWSDLSRPTRERETARFPGPTVVPLP